MINDRHRSRMIVAGIGNAIPSLGNAGLLQSLEVTSEPGNKKAAKELIESKAVLVDEPMTVMDRIFTVRDANGVAEFLEPFIKAVAETPLK